MFGACSTYIMLCINIATVTLKFSSNDLIATFSFPVFPDVPPLGIHFTNDSPRVSGNMVEAEFILTRPALSVTCQISRHQGKDCKCNMCLSMSM